MLETQVNFLTPELLQVDSLVREAAGTLEDALRNLDRSVQQQHGLTKEIQATMNISSEGDGDATGSDSIGDTILGTLNGFVGHMTEISQSTVQTGGTGERHP